MFEKSRAANITGNAKTIPARLVLVSGETFDGTVLVHGVGRLQEALNSSNTFIEFLTVDGHTRHFNKAVIVSLDPLDIPQADQLTKRNPNAAAFDPYHVLSVTSEMPAEQIRSTYHELARKYHPDRFVSAGLPSEVSQYLESMAQRINLAYETISRAHPSAPTQ